VYKLIERDCRYPLTKLIILDKIRVHQQHSTDSEIYDFIKRYSLNKKNIKQGLRDKVSKAFRNVRSERQFKWLVNIVLTFENRRYGPDPEDLKFLNSLKNRRNRF